MQPSISPFYDVYNCVKDYFISIPWTVYNLSFNSNCRILAAELNCTFTYIFIIFSESGIFFWLRLHSRFKFRFWLRLQPKPPTPGDSNSYSATLKRSPKHIALLCFILRFPVAKSTKNTVFQQPNMNGQFVDSFFMFFLLPYFGTRKTLR